MVHLGRLVPADVQVHLTTGRGPCADEVASDGLATRLASAQRYGGGTYVFEGHVADRLLEGRERLAVLVEPRRDARTPAPPGPSDARRRVVRSLA